MKYIKAEEEKFIMRLSYEEIESLSIIFTKAEEKKEGLFGVYTGIPDKDLYAISSFFVKLMKDCTHEKGIKKRIKNLNSKSSNIEHRLNYPDIASKIAYGHSYEIVVKELNEMGNLNIRNRQQFQQYIESILTNKDATIKKLYGGRLLYKLPYGLDVCIIFHPDYPAEGSCFLAEGYFNCRDYYCV